MAEVPDARRQRPGQAVVGHLAAAPPRNETKQKNTVIDPQQTANDGKKKQKRPGSEMGERSGHSQRDDELVRRAGDHGPGAGIDGVDVPVGHDPPLVPQTALNRHERRHCNSRAKPRQEHQKSHSAIEGQVTKP